MAAARLLLRLSGRLESVSFTQSVCGLLGAEQGLGPWYAHCRFERGQLVLASSSFPGASERLPIQRPPFCPFAALDQQPGVSGTELLTNRSVDLSVAVILQSSDQTVLLTRRTCTLRTYPNVWVPPGGHMELDEEILECGLRELREECGLQLAQNQFSCVLLGLWEAELGSPKYHHLILYVLVISQESQQQLQARIQINPNEVSAFMWLGPDVAAAAAAATEEGTKTPTFLSQDLPPSLCATELKDDGETRALALPLSTLVRATPPTAEDKERVSDGTKFALRLWLQHLGR